MIEKVRSVYRGGREVEGVVVESCKVEEQVGGEEGGVWRARTRDIAPQLDFARYSEITIPSVFQSKLCFIRHIQIHNW